MTEEENKPSSGEKKNNAFTALIGRKPIWWIVIIVIALYLIFGR